ncbi:hypothetical protein K1T71_003034 [Dendrolimus kikuchii]|uniref:Uncharacterized protein n=1 Tax=Dendrolimus kikuchii TaxID=765133 RepID=A0ACC1DAF4_9NEOP|nr:hypothetical protein K1T71_003034 [Dendrolimus kikuchii]
MDDRRNYGRNEDYSSRDMYSRLFIVCPKTVTEDILKEAFSEYGTIEDIKLPRDHITGELKGIAYVKFTKTSEAACALEAMDHQYLKNSRRPIKVMVATNRSEIQSEDTDSTKYKRLFITITKNVEEDDVYDEFNKFGEVDSVNILRDWNTGEPKGFAYVLFKKFSDAAHAFEECPKMYRAVFAAPKTQNRRPETSFETNINSLAHTTFGKSSMMPMTNIMNVRPGNYFRVNFMCCQHLTQMQLESLFDIVPGFVDIKYYVDLFGNFGKGTVTYSNPTSAAYAVEKLNEFEYPIGMKVFVKPDNARFDTHERKFEVPTVVNNLRKAIAVASNSTTPDLAQLAEAIADASKLIKLATGLSTQDTADSNGFNYCSVKLPPTQPLTDIDSPVAKRCFLVCKPQPPPVTVLRDVFCRFGNLIDVYTFPNKTVGYARYATEESADQAIKTLHGAEVCGVRIKVLEAEEERQPSKRSRYE